MEPTTGMDVTTAVTAFTDGNVAVATIGLASLVLAIGIKVWQRIKGAA